MIKFTQEDAIKYRRLINKAAISLSDEDALEVPKIFDVWKPDTDYEIGDRVQYNDILYKCLIAHKSQSDWRPDISPSLFAEVLIPDPSVIPEWVQPDSTNPYMMGDHVMHLGIEWVSTMDYNVYEPGVYGWEEVR